MGKKNNKKGGQAKNTPKKSEPVPKPVPVKQPVASKKTVPVEFVAPPPKPSEDQSASILASRMSGGYSGWSAPPTVFKEKSLLEIEEEKRLEKLQNQKQQEI